MEEAEAERDMAIDLHKKTDFQGDVINDIGKDIRGANANLQEIGTEVEKQGKQIDRIDDKLHAGQAQVRATDKEAQAMIRRAKCQKALLWLTNILIFIAIIIIIIIKGTNHYRCTHQEKKEKRKQKKKLYKKS